MILLNKHTVLIESVVGFIDLIDPYKKDRHLVRFRKALLKCDTSNIIEVENACIEEGIRQLHLRENTTVYTNFFKFRYNKVF